VGSEIFGVRRAVMDTRNARLDILRGTSSLTACLQSRRRGTPGPANSRAAVYVIEVVVGFHLAYLAMAANVDSQVARLREPDGSDGDAMVKQNRLSRRGAPTATTRA
jgi:hypothetical protein